VCGVRPAVEPWKTARRNRGERRGYVIEATP
jgi:hypothetical protein